MKYSLTFIAVLFVGLNTLAQLPSFNQSIPISWQAPPFAYNAHGEANSAFEVEDGYLLYGTGILCQPFNCYDPERSWSAKLDLNGTVLWTQTYNEGIDQKAFFAWDRFSDMIKNHNGEITSPMTIAGGGVFGMDSTKLYLATMDDSGAMTSRYLIDDSDEIYEVYGIREDMRDSTYLIYGRYMDSLDVDEGFLMKVDTLGNTSWQVEFANSIRANEVTISSDGGYWVNTILRISSPCGNLNYSNNLSIIKLDQNGEIEDEIDFGGACGWESANIYEAEEDKLIVFGRKTNDIEEPTPVAGHFFTKTIEQENGNGNLVETGEEKRYLNTWMRSRISSLHPLEDGSFVITGYNYSEINTDVTPDEGQYNGFLFKLDANLDSVWYRKYNHFYNEPIQAAYARHYFTNSNVTSDGGFICAGYIEQQDTDPQPYLYTPWVVKTDSFGCLEPGCQFVGIEEQSSSMLETLRVYPNPSSDYFKVGFQMENKSIPIKDTQLLLIDLQGRIILKQNVHHQDLLSGLTLAIPDGVSSGIYQLHWLSESTWLDSFKVVVE